MRRNGPLVELSTVPEVRRKMVVGNAGLLITAWVWILGYEAVDQTALSITFFMAGLHSDAETEVEMAYTYENPHLSSRLSLVKVRNRLSPN